MTKGQRLVSRPREVSRTPYSEAFRQMRTGRPVLIEMPPDACVEREEATVESRPYLEDRTQHRRSREAARFIRIQHAPDIGRRRRGALRLRRALVKLAEATNLPVVTSSGGKGTIPDRHPLSYGSCFSLRGERQVMNQLYEVMQSADVVIGIGARFALGIRRARRQRL